MNRAMRREWIVPALLLIFALSFTVFAIQGGDVLMYLALARDFVLKGEFRATDPYLYSLPNADLHFAHEYLSYLIFYGAWWYGGFSGLIAVKVVGLLLLFVITLSAGPRANNKSALFILLWMIAVFAASFRFIERSSLFSDVLTVGLLAMLLKERAITRRLVIQMMLLFFVWAQLHPGYPAGLALVAIWALWKIFGEADFKWVRTPWLALPLIATTFNPLGLEGALYPFRFALNEAAVLRRHNFEWFASYHPAFITTPEVLAFWMLTALSVALLVRARIYRSNRWPLALFAIAIATQTVRFIPWASFALLILVKPYVPHLALKRERIGQVILAALLVAIAVHNFGWGYTSSSGPRRAGPGLDAAFFPMKSLNFLRAHPQPGRLYNAHDFGSYLVWENYLPIFHHGFVTDMDFYEHDAAGVFESQARFLELAAKYRWSMLLVDKHGSYPYFYKILSPLTNWKIVAEDEASYLIYDLPDEPKQP